MHMNTPLKDSLIILTRIKNQLRNAQTSFLFLVRLKTDIINAEVVRQQDSADIDTAMFGLINYSFLWYVAFKDEFDRYFTVASDPSVEEKIIRVRNNCKKY